MDEVKYFKLSDEYIVTLPNHVQYTIARGSIFHIQSRYKSILTGDDMVVIAMDKCTPIAVPMNAGTILD